MRTPSENIIEEQIEKEQGNENIKIIVPFDPNDININIVPRTIGQLVEMLEYDEILVPKFQRLPGLWDAKKKSRFIESLMLNLPIPLFYFDEGEDKRWRVIDGLQRISTLEHFILFEKKKENLISDEKFPFRLCDMEFRSEYNNKLWRELPREVQRRIQTTQVTINLIGKGTPEQVKYNIFSRINQGGIELVPQEIRTALFQGYRTEFLEKLVSRDTTAGSTFLQATDNSIPSKRQEDLDFVSRFIAFYLIGYQYYEPDMDSFITLGIKQIPNKVEDQRNISTSFTCSMQLAFDVFGTDAFRKRRNISDRRLPINKPLFEVISSSFAKLSEVERTLVKSKKDDVFNGLIELQNDRKFWDSITTGTAVRERVKQRHEDFESLIKKILNDQKNKN